MKELNHRAEITSLFDTKQTLDDSQESLNQSYVKEILHRLEAGLQDTFDRETIRAGAQKRKLNRPSVKINGVVRGMWKGDVLVFDDDYIPPNANPSKQSIAQIKEELYETYGIKLEGIPYIEGVADFRGVAVANIPTVDVVVRAKGMTYEEYNASSPSEKIKFFQEVFSSKLDGKSKREHNFTIADQIAAERQISIPNLPKGYTATQLADWREANKFSWDEQVHAGYSLVPAVIHGNLSHTGLVGTSGNAYTFLEWRSNDIKKHPKKYCWNDDDAPISLRDVEEIKRLKKTKERRRNMRIVGREIDRGKIDNETSIL